MSVVLYPQARQAVLEASSEPEPWAISIEEGREADRRMVASAPRQEVAEARDLEADGVPCRLYRPLHQRTDTLLVHLHGGGFVFGSIDDQDPACRSMANRLGMPVLSVGYRLAPEHPHPAACNDVDTALAWLGDHGWTSLVAHGDSAGANLALVAALRNPGRFQALVLVYPFLDPTAGFDSYGSAADGFPRDRALWFWSQYVCSPADLESPDVAPLRSDKLATLPPTLVVTAEHDPLRDEGEALAAQLAELGVAVTATRYLGQIHGFWGSFPTFAAGDALLDHTAGFLTRWA